MSELTRNKLLEDIAELIMSVSADDRPQLSKLLLMLSSLQQEIPENAPLVARTTIQETIVLINEVVKGKAAHPDNDLESAMRLISALQGILPKLGDVVGPTKGSNNNKDTAEDEVQPAPPTQVETKITSPNLKVSDERTLTLPDQIDEPLFREFISSQHLVLEEIENDILALEKGNQDALGDLRRRIHTMKGEAGMLGLKDLCNVCHTVEDYLNYPLSIEEEVDVLLQVKDWLSQTLEDYAKWQLPSVKAEDILANLKITEGDKKIVANKIPSAPAAAKTTPPLAASTEMKVVGQIQSQPQAQAKLPPSTQPSPAPTVQTPKAPEIEEAPAVREHGAKAERDEETLSLIGDFLQESEEGLSDVDQMLMNLEQGGLTPEKINSMFRTFHTIKGLAGFLEFAEIAKLAHTTETLLNQVRQGQRELKGASLDLVFDATGMMRKLLDFVRIAAKENETVVSQPNLPALLVKIEAAIKGEPLPEPPPAVQVPADTKIGEVLVQMGVVSQPQVEKALNEQLDTGRKLGEELVAQGAVEAKVVAQAIRAQTQATSSSKLQETVKVDLERVDNLVEMIGELVIVESMVVHAPEILNISSPRIRNYLNQLSKISRDLQNVGMRMRMVPVRGVFQKMARMARDLSRKSGKNINVVLSGEGTEMDRSMVEQISDPLVHMIRNCVDHGLESGEERLKAGKPETGTIQLSAYHEGGSIVTEISDDGRGLNREAIVNKAMSQGLIKDGQNMPDHEVWDLIFLPGFSTAKKVTEISGRGVGMDVVKRNIESMRGRVVISSVAGKGSTFKIILPLTLAIIDGMLVASGEERYIIPTLSIVESIKPDKHMLSSFASRGELIVLRGETFPLLRLDDLFNISNAKRDPCEALVVVLESLGRKIGLLVDDVLTQQQVVIKKIGAGIQGTKFVSGAAILSDGRVGLILNVEGIGSLFDERTYRAIKEEIGMSHASA